MTYAVFVEEQHDLPLIWVQVVVRTGPAADPIGKEGLTRHAFELLRRGAGGRNRADIDAAFDALGATLELVPGYDSIGYAFTCLPRNLEAALALVGDVLAKPALDRDEHERLRREELATLDDLRDDDSALCTRFADRMMLPGHPYGRSALGTERSLTSLTLDDVTGWIARNVVADNLLVGFAGAIAAERAIGLARAAFAEVPERPAPAPLVYSSLMLGSARRTFIVDKPERSQSQVIVGHAAPPPSHEAFLALHVAATAFGGSFTSRLMQEVRVKRGWSYGSSFGAVRARGGHSFRMRVAPAAEQTADTLELILGLWEEATANGFSDDEMQHAKQYLEGGWAFDMETAGARLEQRIGVILLDLPEHAVTELPARLAGISTAQVNAAIRQFWHPEAAVTILTASADEQLDTLAHLPLGALKVVPYDVD